MKSVLAIIAVLLLVSLYFFWDEPIIQRTFFKTDYYSKELHRLQLYHNAMLFDVEAIPIEIEKLRHLIEFDYKLDSLDREWSVFLYEDMGIPELQSPVISSEEYIATVEDSVKVLLEELGYSKKMTRIYKDSIETIGKYLK